ncbi:hypothetical protein LO762_29855 [Actinocorallia sp. API 0066]|uniref:B12-binding domain-containing radical SAM protein n=1 Tax=Actinocorallia sp. API 0066 TaxID=2896846 RepID=UPI001E355FA7|nr:hypothetical protein [Actinocorallia sp. API 0066]MCD0453354.1 hypothetical protein [Actinocorallia sp. API 0066]
MNPEVGDFLRALSEQPTPWESAAARLAEIAPGAVLGGDPLRPYAVRVAEDQTSVMAVRPTGLPDAPLVADLLAGRFGVATSVRGGDLWAMTLPTSVELTARLKVPSVLLIGLGDRERYRRARLPLGIARLASWLRYAHAATVEVIDYTVAEAPSLDLVRAALGRAPDVVGVGVNFGQWRMLADLAEAIEAVDQQPVVVLGNILAAFSPDEAAKPFKKASNAGRVLVATGLGERPLQTLCERLAQPAEWKRIPGLMTPGQSIEATGREEPPVLVAPDDGLVLTVAQAGGQVSLETSFGCQYGACTFCPRKHKGEGWHRDDSTAGAAILARFGRLTGPPAISLVDEEFFGSEGLEDPPPPRLHADRIMRACRAHGLRYEVYTRLEQLFDRRHSERWNLRRAALLANAVSDMRRLFVGVESGSPGQLRRYGKGHTISQAEDALRVGSHLGVPLEFGFITFDPLLTVDELRENLAFLARTDIICAPAADRLEAVAAVSRYLDGEELTMSGEPVFQHVAYMATELEVLKNSRYADMLCRRRPDLLHGYDPSFCRYSSAYADPIVEEMAGWCRVWTEGMFAPVYEARMAVRSSVADSPSGEAGELVRRYRAATFDLLRTLTAQLTGSKTATETADVEPSALLAALAARVLPDGAAFDLDQRYRRREG